MKSREGRAPCHFTDRSRPRCTSRSLGSEGRFVGYTWRIWNRSTSFYMKCKASGITQLKLSLHSEDPRHPGKSGFKMAIDTEEDYAASVASGEAAGWRHGDWPL